MATWRQIPRSRRLIARPPRNLLQWLRLREIRPIQNFNLPLSIYRSLKRSIATKDEVNRDAYFYVMTAMNVKTVAMKLQFRPRFYLEFKDVMEIWFMISEVCRYYDEFIAYARDNGVIQVLFRLLRAFYRPYQMIIQLIWVKKECLQILCEINFVICRDKINPFDSLFLRELESILRSDDGLLLSMAILNVDANLSSRIKDEYQRTLSLTQELRVQAPEVFYSLWKKFKECLHITVETKKFRKGYHSILKKNNAVESLVHEAFCLASCIESLLRKPLVEDVRHLLLLASLRLQDLLRIICGLLNVYQRICLCELCKELAFRLVTAGLPRLLLVLMTILLNSSVSHLLLIEGCLRSVSGMLYAISRASYRLEFWYCMFTVSDIDRLLRICEEHPNRQYAAYTTEEIRDALMTARSVVSSIKPAEYVLDPSFQAIGFDLVREVPPNEPLLSIRKCYLRLWGCRMSTEYVFFLLRSGLEKMFTRAISSWPDHVYWTEVNIPPCWCES